MYDLGLYFTNIHAQWKPVGDRIVTPWTEKVDVTSVLPEYPRPIMERNEWKNLNGLWEYAIMVSEKVARSSLTGDISPLCSRIGFIQVSGKLLGRRRSYGIAECLIFLRLGKIKKSCFILVL